MKIRVECSEHGRAVPVEFELIPGEPSTGTPAHVHLMHVGRASCGCGLTDKEAEAAVRDHLTELMHDDS